MLLLKRQLFLLLLSMCLHRVISCYLPESERFDCGYGYMTNEKCLALNCCYDSSTTRLNTPACYYKTKDAAGGPIKHSNGLCIFPKHDYSGLVWSNDCSNKNAMFLVSHDYPTRHIVSGKFILPKNGNDSDPGRNFPLALRSSTITSNLVTFQRDPDGNLRYFYNQGDYSICLVANPEPVEGDSVRFVQPCVKLNDCQHLTYVAEIGIKRGYTRTITCPASSVIQVTWANYGVPLIPANRGYKSTPCTTDTTTNIVQSECNGITSCVIVNTVTTKPACSNSYLIVRYTCLQKAKPPGAPTITVLGMKKLNVTWSPVKTNVWYLVRICWNTLTNNGRCKNKYVRSSNIELDDLQPSTMYFVKVASRNCKGEFGDYSEPTIGITRAAAITKSSKPVSAENFEIILGILKKDDRYIQIIVKKQSNQQQPKSHPESYSNLNSFNEESQGNEPYIAAELDRNYVETKQVFTIGDGKGYSKSTNRKRRNVGFLNAKLKPGTYYSVFQKTFKNDGLYYDSEWMDVVQTANFPFTKTKLINEDSDNKGSDNKGSYKKGVVKPTEGDKGRKSEVKNGSGNIVVIGAVVGGIIAIILIIIILVIVFFRRKGRPQNNSNVDNKPVTFNASLVYADDGERGSVSGSHDQPEEPEVVINEAQKQPDAVYAKPDKTKKRKVKEERDDVYANVVDENVEEDFNDINILNFPSYVDEMKRSNNSGFEMMFKKLHVGQAFPWNVSKDPINAEKFRYGNIVTYDHSRVVLSGDETEDYINASYIDGIRPDIYIASQGPTSKTADDFWRMIWEQDSRSIIALTNVRELGKIKCVQYWPEKESTFGTIHVKMLKEELFADFVIRYLSMEKDGVTKQVEQYHFTSWPDHGVPKCPTQLLAFRRRFKTLHEKGSPPIIVHCSAGVGRTGTFIALDIVLERLEGLYRQTINIHDTVKELRTRRVNMVQTVEQYTFIHDAVLEYIICGVTEIAAEHLTSYIERFEQRDEEKSLTGFELEFQKLNSICPPLSEEECELALRKVNQRKNRDPDIYPAENLRVITSGIGGDYINATHVHGYTQTRAYIATQTPLPDTIDDFWKMVYGMKASVIVMLNNLVEGKMVYPQYWPENINEQGQYGDLFVNMVSCDVQTPIISRKFTIISKSQSSPIEHTVRHLQFTDWPEDGVPSDYSKALLILETMTAAQQYSPNGVIIVQCSNGAHRTGTYLTLVNQRERIMTEHVLDVFRCVKMMRGQRPQFVGNADQYKFCYYALLNFVESYKTYDNIPKSD